MNDYCVYIISNASRMLYVGVTNDIHRRMSEHRQKLHPGYAARYSITRLVYYEAWGDIGLAIAREKHLKGWTRGRKEALIRDANPEWHDLCADWFQEVRTVMRGDATARGDSQ